MNKILLFQACIFISTNCEEKGDCEKIISYVTQPDDWVVIELFYNATNPDTNYAAIGFSEDTLMASFKLIRSERL